MVCRTVRLAFKLECILNVSLGAVHAKAANCATAPTGTTLLVIPGFLLQIRSRRCQDVGHDEDSAAECTCFDAIDFIVDHHSGLTSAMLRPRCLQPSRSLPVALVVLLCCRGRELAAASAPPGAASSNSSASWEDGAAASAHNNPWPQVPWQPIFFPQALMFLVVLGAALRSEEVRKVAWWKLLGLAAGASAPLSDTVSDSLVTATFYLGGDWWWFGFSVADLLFACRSAIRSYRRLSEVTGTRGLSSRVNDNVMFSTSSTVSDIDTV